eukprot:Gb_27390 [translate_table: standard]
MKNLSGKRVLVTSNGDEVSFNLALNLVRTGCRLVLAGNGSQLGIAAERIMNSMDEGGERRAENVEVIDLNVNGSEQTVDGAVDRAWQSLGAIDAFVSCHTYEGDLTMPLDLHEEEFDKILGVNLKGTWIVCKAVGKRMRDYGIGGSFIFVTSIIGTERGLYPGAAAYGSCLAGVHHLARALAMELGKYKIRVNAVARGLHNLDAFPSTVSEEKREEKAKDIVPLQRWLDVKNDLASTVLYLVGDDSSFMTGTVIFVDGGQSIVRPRMRSYM